MYSKLAALEIFRKTLPNGYDVVEEWTIECDYGWVFFAQSSRFLVSQDSQDIAIGSAGALVEKATGNIIHFESGYSTETSLEMYESGLLIHDSIDIFITEIFDEREAISLVMSLQLRYIVPEFDCGVVWRVPKQYKYSQIKQFLCKLPCRFNIGSPYACWQQLEQLKASKALKFEILPNAGFQNLA